MAESDKGFERTAADEVIWPTYTSMTETEGQDQAHTNEPNQVIHGLLKGVNASLPKFKPPLPPTLPTQY